MKPTYGIIGCGNISQYYFEALHSLGATIAHVADVDASLADECGRRCGARASKDYADVIKDPDVTAVAVLAHTRFHEDMCLAAIEAGKDVICEKTMAASADQAYNIAQRVQATDVLFFMAYMKRFFPAVEKARELLGQLGTIYSVHARSWQAWGDLFNAENVPVEIWLTRYGGGVLKCCGSHILDLIMFLLGRPHRVYANMDFVEGSELDRKLVALLEYDGSCVVNFETVGHSLKKIGYQRNGWDERMEINGTNGRLDIYTTTWNKPEECAALLVHYDSSTETSCEYRFDAVNTFHRQIGAFHQCLTARKQGHPNVIDGYNVDVLISTIEKSSKQRQPVEIDWRGL